MAKIFLTSFLVLFIFLMHCTQVLSQGPAPAPGPSGPANVIKILGKAGQYSTFIRLLQTAQVGDRLNIQLKSSDQGLTIFAPTDDAFSNLKSGMLNSLSDQQKVELIQFHVLPTFYSVSQFDTASNPLQTQAGGFAGQFPLNVTTTGSSVNITTDMVNTTITNTIYTDGQLAIYRVDKVLLPHGLFVSPPPPPPPLKPKEHPSTNSTVMTPVLTSDGIRESKLALRSISSVLVILGAFFL